MSVAPNASFPLQSKSSSNRPSIEIVLSRPTYRIGRTVVGTVRLLPNNCNILPRSCFESAQLYVKGSCQIDSRWHNVDEYQKIYGVHPHLSDHGLIELKVKQDATVCFWATNVLSLLHLEERQGGHWKDVKPKPIKLSSKLSFDLEKKTSEAADDEVDMLDGTQMTFTFRADLPMDLPHSTSLTCCRYTYFVVVHAKTVTGESLIVTRPFTVLSPLNGFTNIVSTGRVKLGSCQAMAHSTGLPFHITVDEMYEARGQVTVNRHTSFKAKSKDIQTLRVADPHGRPCCILTVIGSVCMYPGGRLLFQMDFPISGDTWLPCYQVSASLQGEELAVYEDKTQRRARSYVFDTHHEVVEFGCTERLTFSLLLPLDCPYSLQSDMVKVGIICALDLTVGNFNGGYTNLRLELPIKVIHAPTADEMDRDEQELPSLQELLYGSDVPIETDPRNSCTFPTRDIQKDMKILSYLLVDSCGLKDKRK